MPDKSNLSKLTEILTDTLTKSDFVESFRNVVTRIKVFETQLTGDFRMLASTLNSKYQTLEQSLKDIIKKDIADTQRQLTDRINMALKEQADGLNFIRDKARQLQAGKDGLDGKDGLQGIPGKDAPIETGDQMIEKINAGTKLIAASAIGGLEEQLTKLGETANKKGTTVGWGAHPLNIYQTGTLKAKVARHINFKGTAVSSVVQKADGTIDVTLNGGAGSATIYAETPTGAVDGANKTYTTANAVTTIISIAINGQFIHPAEYSTDASGFTMVTALPLDLAGTGFTVVYT